MGITKKPIILLLGAKSSDSPLDSIPAELSQLKLLFEQKQSDQLLFDIQYEPYFTKDLLKKQLQKHSGNIAILHFAGHSDEATLQTDDEQVYSHHIANILKTWSIQPSLIFLNGCHNAKQVQLFLDVSVENVIATHRPIDDKKAASFAHEFYSALFAENGEVRLQQAFERAGEKVFLGQQGQARSLNLKSLQKVDHADWDWGLFPKNPEYLQQWTITQLISENRPILDKKGVLLNPYRGLEAFREQDQIWFFGREVQSQELSQQISDTRFFALLGASGSGKSSLISAGVIPQYRADEDLIILRMRPGNSPFVELASIFASALYPDTLSKRLNEQKALTKQLEEQTISLPDLVSGLLDRQSKRKLLLSIDQFEETFTHSENTTITAFLSQLIRLIDSDTNSTLLLVMRVDFLSSALANSRFAELMDEYPHKLLAPMGKAELRAAIEKPANKQHVQIESSLVEALLDDVENQPGSLPLLQYVLSLLWEKRQASHIKLQDYNDFGGLEKALESRANGIYQSFSKEHKKQCKQIFLRLIQPGEGTEDTRRRAYLDEFSDQPEAQNVIKTLADARLITTQQTDDNDKAFAEVSHEALIRHWAQLREWIAENRDALRTQHQISSGAREWEVHEKDNAWLLHGTRLRVAEDWIKENENQATPLEVKFVKSAVKIRESRRKRNRNVVVSFIAILSILAVFAATQWFSAIKARDDASRNEQIANNKRLESNYNLAKIFEQKTLYALEQGDKEQEDGGSKKLIEYKKAWLYALEALKLETAKDKERLQESTLELITNISGNALTRIRQISLPTKTKDVITNEESDEIIADLAYSHDGDVLAYAQGNSIHLKDTKTGKLIKSLEGHTDSITDIAYSSNGARIASGSADKSIRLWNTKTGKLERILEGHTEQINSISYSSNDRYIASVSNDRSIRLWDAQSGKQIRSFHDPSSQDVGFTVSFNPNGSILAVGFGSGIIRLWEVESKQSLHSLRKKPDEIMALVFSPDGKTLLSGDVYGQLYLWNVQDGYLLYDSDGILDQHEDSITTLAFTKNGSAFFSGSNDGTVRSWDAKTNQLIQKIEPHEGKKYISSISVSSDEKLAVAAENSLTIKEQDSGKVLQELSDTDADRVLHPNGEIVATNEKNLINIWNVSSGKLIKTLHNHDSYFREEFSYGVDFLKFSPNGEALVAATDSIVSLWDTRTWKYIKKLDVSSTESIKALFFNSSGKILVTASSSNINLWNVENGKQKISIEIPNEYMVLLKYSPDENMLVSGHYRKIYLWDAHSGDKKAVLEGHEGFIDGLKFSPNGKIIASVSNDKSIRLWNAQTGEHIASIDSYLRKKDGSLSYSGQELVASVNLLFSPDGKVLASVYDKTIDLWNTQTGEHKANLKGHANDIETLEFSSKGDTLFSLASGEGYIWDAQTGKLISIIETELFFNEELNLSSAGKTVIALSERGKRIWDITYKKLKVALNNQLDNIRYIKFGIDRTQLFTISVNGSVSQINTNTGEQVQYSGSSKVRENAISLSPDGLKVAIMKEQSINIYNTFSSNLITSIKTTREPIKILFIDNYNFILLDKYGGVEEWNIKTGNKQNSFKVKSSNLKIISATISKNRELLSLIRSSSRRSYRRFDNYLSIFNINSKNEVFINNRVRFTVPKFSPDSELLIAITDNKSIGIWDVATGELKKTLNQTISSFTINFNSETLAYTTSNNLYFYQNHEQDFHSWKKTGKFNSISLNKSGKVLASSSDDNYVNLWDTNTGELIEALKGHVDTVSTLTYNSNGSILASGSADKTVRLWDVKTHKIKHILKGHTGKINSLAFSPDGKVLASASKDNTIHLWNSNNGSIKKVLSEHSQEVSKIIFSPNGKLLASASSDKKIRLWSVETGELLASLNNKSNRVTELRFSKDNNKIAVTSEDRIIKLWDIENKKLVHSNALERDVVDIFHGNQSFIIFYDNWAVVEWDILSGEIIEKFSPPSIMDYKFSPNGKIIASIKSGIHGNESIDYIELWDVRSGALKHELKENIGKIKDWNFNPSGSEFAAISHDGTLRIWDVESAKLIKTIQGYSDEIFTLSYSADGQLHAASVSKNKIHLWGSDEPAKKLFYDYDPGQVSKALQLLWELKLDSDSLSITTQPLTHLLFSDDQGNPIDIKYKSLFDLPNPGETKMDQLVRFLEEQCAYKDQSKRKRCHSN